MDSGHCYCGKLDPAQPAGSLQCLVCRKRFHQDCLDAPVMTSLHGDGFFIFKCRNCGEGNKEELKRGKISWMDAIALTLYNLQRGGGGKCGYYRWKEHICSFIDKNWVTFFGHDRKKTNTWSGTVAGTLSAHCPRVFLSGLTELGESGWWRLAEMNPPTYNVEQPAKVIKKKRTHGITEIIHDNDSMNSITERPRRPRSQPFSLTAAIELKARRVPECKTAVRRRHTRLDLDGSCSEHDSAAASSSKVEACSAEQISGEMQTVVTKAPPGAKRVEIDSAVTAPGSGDTAPTEPHITVLVKIEPPDHVPECASQPVAEGVSDVAASPSAGAIETKDAVTVKEEAENDTVSHLLGVDVDSDESDMEIDPGSFSPVTNVGLSNELYHSTVVDDMMLYLNDGQEMMPSTPDQCRAADRLSRQSSQSQLSVTSDSKAANDPERGTGRLSQRSSRSHLSVTSDRKAADDPESDLDCPSEGAEDEETSEEEEKDSFGEESGEDDTERVEESQVRGEQKRHQKRRIEEEQLQKEKSACNLRLMTPYDEKLILKQLNKIMHKEPVSSDDKPLQPWEADRLKHKRNVLRRKLIVRRLKREKGLPIFDLDATLAAMSQSQLTDQPESLGLGMPMNKRPQGWERTLDRFLLGRKKGRYESQHKDFRTRLVGFDDDHLQPITSPYTMRVLKPFIWRNQETMPNKVKLLHEIIAYPHRNDPTWQQPSPATLDYCYVRPQHIPAVNALCRTFFWPGIDLAECLQYPDFSCVVMYKKLVVAFAFLVPDVKHNEAYISFIFTHPEWRGAGIATFMLYHLIQTCMGKDVTLHVSATNPAMLLYSKFGFKAEELCLDFYDKYLPVESKECRHAFFMRLRR